MSDRSGLRLFASGLDPGNYRGSSSTRAHGGYPLDCEGLWRRCYDRTSWFGRKGVAVSALGEINIALRDLKGRAEGKPVSELAGATRDSVPAYASGLL